MIDSDILVFYRNLLGDGIESKIVAYLDDTSIGSGDMEDILDQLIDLLRSEEL
jgi:hypothetical protein